jgi:O-antigen/teichoic acid export membrane protein
MSRLKRFTHALISGYVLLGANVVYTLAAFPLAQSYLSPAEFGLWALTLSIAMYIAVIDVGMSGSISRILVDHKDNRRSGEFGGAVKTAALVGAAQGAIVFLVGSALAFVIGPLVDVPAKLSHEFTWLLIGQSAILAITFAARILTYVLAAHQRFDIANYGQILFFPVSYGVMWFCFSRNVGVFSFLAGQAAGTAVVILITLFGCVWLKLFPARGEWGKASWKRFKEFFSYGRDIFLYAFGVQLVSTSQTVLLTRLFGLDVAAVWAVCTRAYLFVQQLVSRVFDYSTPALAEMIVRGEKEMLRRRFREIVIVTSSLAIAMGTVFAVCNMDFVIAWMHRKPIVAQIKFDWSRTCDVLLAVWLVISTAARTHIGMAGQTKDLRFVRYIYFLEGLVFATLTVLLHRFGGIALMIAVSVLCSLSFSLPYALKRSSAYFKMSLRELAEWYRAPAILLLWTAPVSLIMWFLTNGLAPLARFGTNAIVISALVGWLFLRHGVGKPLQSEMVRRAPNWVKPILERILFPRATL